MPKTDEIRARLEAATPGPWAVSYPDRFNVTCQNGEEQQSFKVDHNLQEEDGVCRGDCLAVIRGWGLWFSHGDSMLVSHAPSDVSWLLAEVERLRETLREISDTCPPSTICEEIARKALEEDL